MMGYHRNSLHGDGTPKERAKSRRDLIRRSACRVLGDQCARCGLDDHRVFQIDHINNDGHLTPKTWDQVKGYKDVLASPHRYQLLCANCHQIKTLFPAEF